MITVKGARAWVNAFRLRFGYDLDIEIVKTLDAYERAMTLEKPWRDQIPENFRITDVWTRAELEHRIEELSLSCEAEEIGHTSCAIPCQICGRSLRAACALVVA